LQSELSPLMLAACGTGKRRCGVQGSAPGSGIAARHVHDPQRPGQRGSTRPHFLIAPEKLAANLNPAHKLLEGIAKLFGMAKVTGAAAGRDFLRNHNHTRGVCWLGRSFLPTDFPDPDRPCERNPGPPTGVSSFQRRSREVKPLGLAAASRPLLPVLSLGVGDGLPLQVPNRRRGHGRPAALCDLSGSRDRHRS